MGRINIVNSKRHGDDLTCGWDVNGNCYFVLLDDNDENPSFWSPVIDSIDGVDDAFGKLNEPLPIILREALIDQRMDGDEESYFYDAEQRRFVSPEEFKEDEKW